MSGILDRILTVKAGEVEAARRARPAAALEELVRSKNQTPNPGHPNDDATMGPGGDLGKKRNTL